MDAEDFRFHAVGCNSPPACYPERICAAQPSSIWRKEANWLPAIFGRSTVRGSRLLIFENVTGALGCDSPGK
jgi:hypothetical protein